MGFHAAEGVSVILKKRQKVQSVRGGCIAFRPGAEGERQTSRLHPAPQNPEQECEVHQDRGAARGEVAEVARGAWRKGVDHDRRNKNLIALNFENEKGSKARFDTESQNNDF